MDEWKEVINQLDKEDFTLPLTQGSVENNTLVIKTPNKIVIDLVQERYDNDRFIKTAKNIFKKPINEVKFVIDPSLQPKETSPRLVPEKIKTTPPQIKATGLNPDLTFDNFVVGESNLLVYNAVQGIISNLGKNTPFLIFAQVGLGKTHILHALGNKVIKTHPHIKVLYCPATKFIDEFVKSTLENTKQNFHSKYRTNDLILIDDIQNLSGKEKTQEEFFDLYNEMQLSHRQMVFTSDRHPGKISNLTDRVSSRLWGGFFLPINPPDRDLRIRILQQELKDVSDKVSNLYLQIIANDITGDIRKLKSIAAGIKNIIETGTPISMELIAQLMEKVLKKEITKKQVESNPEIQQILEKTAHYFNITKEVLLAKDRVPFNVHARDIATYLLYEQPHIPFREIATLFDRALSPTFRAYNKIKANSDATTKQEINTILNLLQK